MTRVTKTLQPIAAAARMISGPTFAPIAPNDSVPTAQMITPSIAIPPRPSTARRLTAHSKSYRFAQS